MKMIKIWEKNSASLKRTTSPVSQPGEEQLLQDADKPAASCVSVPALSLGSAEKGWQKETVAALAEPHLGKVKSQRAITSRKDDV